MMEWPSVSLGELCSIVGGGTPDRGEPTFYGGSIPWVTPKDMKRWEIDSAQVNITEAALRGSAAKLISPNSVLVVVRSGVLKHTLPVALNRVPVAINQDLKALRCDPRLDPDFCAHLLKARSRTILRWVRATTADNFPVENLQKLYVSLPPISEQRRIAKMLDKADALRARRRAALAQLDVLTQSIFVDMFGDPHSETRWESVPLGDHATKIGSGATPTGGEETYKRSGIALIRSMNVRDGRFDPEGLAYIDDEQARRLAGVIVEPDDVLLNITGASVARVCRVPDAILPARVNQHVAIIRPTASFTPAYLEHCLLTPAFKRRLLRIAEAGATREAITKREIENLEIPRPPRNLQEKFSAAVAHLKTVRRLFEEAVFVTDALFASLQHRAFRGEL